MLLLHPVSSLCVFSLSIGFLHLTSAHCAGSLRYGGAAGEAWLQGSADAGWSVRSGIIEEGKGEGRRERRDGCCCSGAVPTPGALQLQEHSALYHLSPKGMKERCNLMELLFRSFGRPDICY